MPRLCTAVGCREYCLKDSACAAWTFDFTDPGHLNTSQCILSESPAKADVAYNYSEAGECTKNTSVSNFAGLTAHAGQAMGQAPPLATSTKAPEGMLRKPFDLPSAKNVTRNCSAIFPNTCANGTKLSGGASCRENVTTSDSVCSSEECRELCRTTAACAAWDYIHSWKIPKCFLFEAPAEAGLPLGTCSTNRSQDDSGTCSGSVPPPQPPSPWPPPPGQTKPAVQPDGRQEPAVAFMSRGRSAI